MYQRVTRSLAVLTALVALVVGGLIGLALPASAAATVVYQHSWSPPLALTSNYKACCKTSAGVAVPPTSLNVYGSQASTLTVTMRTRWVDWKARHDSPNIVQQGRWATPPLIKMEIGQGAKPAAHRAVCMFVAANGRRLTAVGPPIDIADGAWHTVTCQKSHDTATATAARADVDGVMGTTVLIRGNPLGNLISGAPVTLGGRTSVASSDSLDGNVSRMSYVVS